MSDRLLKRIFYGVVAWFYLSGVGLLILFALTGPGDGDIVGWERAVLLGVAIGPAAIALAAVLLYVILGMAWFAITGRDP